MNDNAGLKANIERVRERIVSAAIASGRAPGDITLIAVTKKVDTERVLTALTCDIHDIGENYVQEARVKIPEITTQTNTKISCHLIGHLQSNKVKYSVGLFTVLHTVDNYQLVQEIDKQAAKQSIIQNILFEVNLAGSGNRAGITSEELPRLFEQAASFPHVRVLGLMGMAPVVESADTARPYFAHLHQLFNTLPPENRQILSMGMSGDFEAAIAEGATHIRIGTAIFGLRQ